MEVTAPGSRTLACDLSGCTADLATVDAVARLVLAARRLAWEIRLCHASPELLDLLSFAGLGEALGVEACGQAEQGEEHRRVEEERELGDPAG